MLLGVHDPDERLVLLGAECRQRHRKRYLAIAGNEYPRALPQLSRHLAFGESDTGGESARLGIGRRRHLADASGETLIGLRPEFHLDHLTNLETTKALLRQADRHLTLTIGSQSEHSLTGRHHLPHFDRTTGDHAVLRGPQHGIVGLIAGHVVLGLDLFQTRFASTVLVLDVVELRAADQIAPKQRLVALTLGAHGLQVGLGCRHLRADGFQLQAHVLRVQLGQWLILLHPVADIHRALAHLAGDTEGQLRLVTCTHLARIAVDQRCSRLRLHHHGRTDRLLRLFTVTAGRQQEDETQRSNERENMARHV